MVPTLGYEGFGLVVVEAGFMGCPSMVTDVGALPEVIETLNDYGTVVEPEKSSITRFLLAVNDSIYPCRKSLAYESHKKYSANRLEMTRVKD